MLEIGSSVFVKESYIRLLQEVQNLSTIPEWMVSDEPGRIVTYRRKRSSVEYLISFDSTPESVWVPSSELRVQND